jgi:hypothetical protein
MVDLRKNAIAIAFRMDGKKSETHSFFNKVRERLHICIF